MNQPSLPSGTTTPIAPPAPSASPLGQILVELGAVGAVDVLLAAYEQDLGDSRRLGEILIANGLVTREEVEVALASQLPGRPANSGTAPEAARKPPPAPAVAPPGPAPVDLAEFPRHQPGWLRAVQAFTLVGLLVAAVVVVADVPNGAAVGVTLYGALTLPYLLIKLLLSLRYRASRTTTPSVTEVTVVVPYYNEDPATFERCLSSIVNQTMRPSMIYVVDDGSPSRACFDVANHFAAQYHNIAIHRFPENRGKRAAQAWGFSQATTDVVATVDSDTVLHPEALAEGVKPFDDPGVNGVCGYARGLNRRRNLLTRLIDLRYTNAFLYERAAYSVLGSVLCSTGVLSVWRRQLLLDHMDDYLQQRFLGTEVHYGDDRRLTAYALRTGRVVLQDTAIALTALPESVPQFVRQQVRWNKSFLRESLLLLKQMRPTRIAWWLGFGEFAYWMVLTTMLLFAVAVRPIVESYVPSWHYAAFIALMAYARSIRMMGDGGRLLPVSFLMAPIYGVLNLVVLVPLRLYSILRLRDGSWGTRKRRGLRRRTENTAPTNVAAVAPPAEPAAPADAAAAAAAAPVAAIVRAPVAQAPVAPPQPCVNILPAGAAKG